MLRRLAHLAAATGCVAVSLPAVALATASLGCGSAAAAGEIRVTVVVDFGTTAQSPGTQSSTCVSLPEGSTGMDAMTQRARDLGVAPPRVDASGLICGFDGFPASGCGQAVGSDYQYWSYWVGTTGSWRYSSSGPSYRRLSDGAIEGWRFIQGRGTGADNAPRTPPISLCTQAATPTSATVQNPGTSTPSAVEESIRTQPPHVSAPPNDTTATEPLAASTPTNTEDSVLGATTLATTATPSPTGGTGELATSQQPASASSTTPSATEQTPSSADDSLSGEGSDSRGSSSWIAAAAFVVGAVVLATVQARRRRLRDL